MRGRDAVAVAVRHPDGEIVTATEPLDSLLHRSRFARAPLFRGIVLLYETLVVGTRWLMRSGSIQAAGEGVEMGRGTIATTLIITFAFAIGLFVILPLFLSKAATDAALGPGQAFIQHLVEGLIRVAIFVGYLLIISRSPDISRVFRYHGAEHMTIHALEHDDPLTIERIRQYPTAHPRCGTEFLVVFVVVSILLFSLLAGQSLLVSIVGRILLIPVIAAVSYELLRFGAFRGKRFYHFRRDCEIEYQQVAPLGGEERSLGHSGHETRRLARNQRRRHGGRESQPPSPSPLAPAKA